MEGLNLEDLNFEDDANVFDAFAEPTGDKPEGEELIQWVRDDARLQTFDVVL